MTGKKLTITDLIEEERKAEATKPEKKVPAAPKTASKTVKEKKQVMGRPVSKPPSKLVTLHLPLSLIERMDHVAAQHFVGNKSAMTIKALEELLERFE